jgi:hypothetical protein
MEEVVSAVGVDAICCGDHDRRCSLARVNLKGLRAQQDDRVKGLFFGASVTNISNETSSSSPGCLRENNALLRVL